MGQQQNEAILRQLNDLRRVLDWLAEERHATLRVTEGAVVASHLLLQQSWALLDATAVLTKPRS
jgi:hypothetical protein